jgi:hypothetical protein
VISFAKGKVVAKDYDDGDDDDDDNNDDELAIQFVDEISHLLLNWTLIMATKNELF